MKKQIPLILLVLGLLVATASTQEVKGVGGNGIGKIHSLAASVGSTTTLALGSGAVQLHTVQFVAGNIATLTASNIPTGTVMIILTQDSVGGRTAGWDTSIFKFAGGTRPILSTAANAVDVFEFVCDGSVCRIKTATYDVK